MAKPFPINPKHPERICWGCDRYCPADSLACGNGADRTMHPAEMIGDDWYLHGDWGIDPPAVPASVEQAVSLPVDGASQDEPSP